jgi:hypothetical protein
MNPVDAEAVAEYLKDGGHIVKVQDAILATDQDIIEYLAACGHHARYSEGDRRRYLCDGKRFGEAALVELANRYRRAHGLAPFALRLDATPLRAMSSKSTVGSDGGGSEMG